MQFSDLSTEDTVNDCPTGAYPRFKSIGLMLHTPRAVYRDYTPAGPESRRRMILELKVGQTAGRLLACAIRSPRRTVFKDNLSPI